MSYVWHLHRDDFNLTANTVRGTLTGRGELDHVLVLQTVENLEARIPAGHTYQLVWDYFHGGGYPCFEIVWPWDEDEDGNPDRDRLLIHAANAVRNLKGEKILLGCVAPGMKRVDNFWDLNPKAHTLARGLPGVSSSRKALELFHKANAARRSALLKVTEAK